MVSRHFKATFCQWQCKLTVFCLWLRVNRLCFVRDWGEIDCILSVTEGKLTMFCRRQWGNWLCFVHDRREIDYALSETVGNWLCSVGDSGDIDYVLSETVWNWLCSVRDTVHIDSAVRDRVEINFTLFGKEWILAFLCLGQGGNWLSGTESRLTFRDKEEIAFVLSRKE